METLPVWIMRSQDSRIIWNVEGKGWRIPKHSLKQQKNAFLDMDKKDTVVLDEELEESEMVSEKGNRELER